MPRAKKGQQKVPTLKKTKGLVPSRCHYSTWIFEGVGQVSPSWSHSPQADPLPGSRPVHLLKQGRGVARRREFFGSRQIICNLLA